MPLGQDLPDLGVGQAPGVGRVGSVGAEEFLDFGHGFTGEEGGDLREPGKLVAHRPLSHVRQGGDQVADVAVQLEAAQLVEAFQSEEGFDTVDDL